jgi:hypothetical protein
MDSEQPAPKASRKRQASPSTTLVVPHAAPTSAAASLPDPAKDALIDAVLGDIVGRLTQNGTLEDLVHRMGTAVAEQIRIDDLAQRLATEYAAEISARLPAAIFAQSGGKARPPLDDRRGV